MITEREKLITLLSLYYELLVQWVEFLFILKLACPSTPIYNSMLDADKLYSRNNNTVLSVYRDSIHALLISGIMHLKVSDFLLKNYLMIY